MAEDSGNDTEDDVKDGGPGTDSDHPLQEAGATAQTAEDPDSEDSKRRLEALFQDDISGDIRSAGFQIEPGRNRSFIYAVIAVIAAATGGLAGWIFLQEDDYIVAAPSERYGYIFPPPQVRVMVPSPQEENSQEENTHTDALSPVDGDSLSPAHETIARNQPADNTTEDQTADPGDQRAQTPEKNPEKNKNPATVSEQSTDDQKPGNTQIVAFSPIRYPQDILPESLINKTVTPLNPDPLPELTETINQGSLPSRSLDGRQPWQEYKRDFTPEKDRPLIAIIIDDTGLNQERSMTMIQSMPSPISFAFTPYGQNLTALTALARKRGHEILLSVPMEPFNYPLDDPGPYGLLTGVDDNQNLQKLFWIMSRLTTYVGVIPEMGSLFTTSREAVEPILKEFKKRGLLFIDRRITQRDVTGRLAKELDLPNVTVDFVLDQKPSRAAIDRQIKRAEALARSQGFVTVLASPYPVSLERVALWLLTLEKKGFSIAPITAVTALSERSASSIGEAVTVIAESTGR